MFPSPPRDDPKRPKEVRSKIATVDGMIDARIISTRFKKFQKVPVIMGTKFFKGF